MTFAGVNAVATTTGLSVPVPITIGAQAESPKLNTKKAAIFRFFITDS
jgi:hypothetical protein